MSFSAQVKQYLSKIANLSDKEAVKFELLGYLISQNTICKNRSIQYTTENEYTINRFGKLLSNMGMIEYSIIMKGKNFIIRFPNKSEWEEIKIVENNIQADAKKIVPKVRENDKLLKAYIRGVFLGSGSINHPEKKYHLEILISTSENSDILQEILEDVDIHMKRLDRKNGSTLYLKEGEEISNFLALIGANPAVLKFEEIRVLRQMKNNINRKVNCETANLSKTVTAAVTQIEAIKKLQQQGKFETLPENLKEIAILRMENPDASLIQLGELLTNPIGKSGVNHRLKAIIEISKNEEKK